MSVELLEDEPFGNLSLNSFRASALFERTFDEGMSLVEECARYLDGRGRNESRTLSRRSALVYAGESMRVTTRLMQAASWLLIQRAVHDGDMSAEDAASERYRLGAREICMGKREEGVDALPGKTHRTAGPQRESLPAHRAARRCLFPTARRGIGRSVAIRAFERGLRPSRKRIDNFPRAFRAP